ncbi:hypothetical protein P7L75_27950 [Tistrella mobilis]|uniref:hypothetical protein n=1 Tax=Tistrella mobilis TaxID=171437 RepID=UPI003555FAFC
MLSKLHRLFSGKKVIGGLEPLRKPEWNLQGKPFLVALLGRYAYEAHSASNYLEEVLGGSAISFPQNLNEAIESAVVEVAGMVMMDAMSDQGVNRVHLPGDPWQKQHVAACVFGQYVGFVMCVCAQAEGVHLDVRKVVLNVITNLTMAHPETDFRSLALPAFSEFQGLLEVEGQTVDDWKESANKLVQLYVLQWNNDDPDISKIETRELFSELFASMLRALN